MSNFKHWLNIAKVDLDAAQKHTTGKEVRIACWLSQQAAEKSLKAAHMLEFGRFRHTHDLDDLRDELPKGWSIKDTHTNLGGLTGWGTEGRYPEMFEFTDADAQHAIKLAREIYDSIIADFQKRGAV